MVDAGHRAYALVLSEGLQRALELVKEAIGIFYGDSAGGDSAFRYYAGVIWVEPLKADGSS